MINKSILHFNPITFIFLIGIIFFFNSPPLIPQQPTHEQSHAAFLTRQLVNYDVTKSPSAALVSPAPTSSAPLPRLFILLSRRLLVRLRSAPITSLTLPVCEVYF